ncbi:MAG: sigma-70 family RNA polymerase sigma factor [Planctomycetes bacterium]|nr:sigma-70 family RNA polymerase sigma factor [Planctomycetota bacterium]
MASTDGPAPARFPDTRWSLVLAGDRGLALEHLASAYWRPIYGYVRAQWARDEAEALDATQDFFVRLIEGDLLERADPRRGRFRAYVRAALSNFLVDEARRRGARRRGGGRRFVPLEEPGALDLPDPRGRSPEEALDHLWRAEVLGRAARDLERELLAEGKAKWWAIFREHTLSDEGASHAVLAKRHGVSPVDVSNWLARSRARYRQALIRVVRETVEGEAALGEELAWILGEGPG